MIDVKIFNVTVLMTNCCLLTDRKTGKMAYNNLVNGEDITKMKVEAAPNVTKEYIKDRCDTYGIKVPDGYTEIKAE